MVDTFFLILAAIPLEGGYVGFNHGLIVISEMGFLIFFTMPLIIRANQFIEIYGDSTEDQSEFFRTSNLKPISYPYKTLVRKIDK